MATQSLAGVTRDAAGVRKSGVVVEVYDAISHALLGSTISDSSGNYSVVWSGASTLVFGRAYLAGQPDTAGTTLDVAPGAAAHSPVVSVPIPDQSATQGISFSFTFSSTAFTDPDGGALTYGATKADGTPLPGWATFSPSTRTFGPGTPAGGDVGVLAVKVTATNPAALSISDNFNITVASSGGFTPALRFNDARNSMYAPIIGGGGAALSAVTPSGGGGGFTPALKFNDARNSQYVPVSMQ